MTFLIRISTSQFILCVYIFFLFPTLLCVCARVCVYIFKCIHLHVYNHINKCIPSMSWNIYPQFLYYFLICYFIIIIINSFPVYIRSQIYSHIRIPHSYEFHKPVTMYVLTRKKLGLYNHPTRTWALELVVEIGGNMQSP